MEHIQNFLNNKCSFVKSNVETISDIHASYINYIKENHINSYIYEQKGFTCRINNLISQNKLQNLIYKKIKGVHSFVGIKIKSKPYRKNSTLTASNSTSTTNSTSSTYETQQNSTSTSTSSTYATQQNLTSSTSSTRQQDSSLIFTSTTLKFQKFNNDPKVIIEGREYVIINGDLYLRVEDRNIKVPQKIPRIDKVTAANLNKMYAECGLTVDQYHEYKNHIFNITPDMFDLTSKDILRYLELNSTKQQKQFNINNKDISKLCREFSNYPNVSQELIKKYSKWYVKTANRVDWKQTIQENMNILPYLTFLFEQIDYEAIENFTTENKFELELPKEPNIYSIYYTSKQITFHSFVTWDKWYNRLMYVINKYIKRNVISEIQKEFLTKYQKDVSVKYCEYYDYVITNNIISPHLNLEDEKELDNRNMTLINDEFVHYHILKLKIELQSCLFY